MQNRYVGDIGDFGKYGLLRRLCADDLSLGVVWYLVPDEGSDGNGAHVGYLDPTSTNLRRFSYCDPDLYDALGEVVHNGTRSVRRVSERAILPPGTVFYEEPLSFEGMPGIGSAATKSRLDHRSDWVQGALEATQGCDVVFADPDNGLESGTPRHHRKGPKFAYYDELVPYLKRGQSLVIYHHLHRSYSTKQQVRERLAQIHERLGESFALLYKRGSPRVFFVVPSEAHRRVFSERARRPMEGCWGQHFALDGTEEAYSAQGQRDDGNRLYQPERTEGGPAHRFGRHRPQPVRLRPSLQPLRARVRGERFRHLAAQVPQLPGRRSGAFGTVACRFIPP